MDISGQTGLSTPGITYPEETPEEQAMRAAFVTIALCFAVSPSSAQENPVEPGERVRVRKGCRQFATNTSIGRGIRCPKHIGDFVSADTTRVVLIDEALGARMALPLDSVRHLDLYLGRTALGVGKGAGIGSVVGGATSVMLGTTGWYAAAGAALGFVAGLLINYEDWEEVPLDRLALAPTGLRESFGVAALIRF
jgi:hypothetical protein